MIEGVVFLFVLFASDVRTNAILLTDSSGVINSDESFNCSVGNHSETNFTRLETNFTVSWELPIRESSGLILHFVEFVGFIGISCSKTSVEVRHYVGGEVDSSVSLCNMVNNPSDYFRASPGYVVITYHSVACDEILEILYASVDLETKMSQDQLPVVTNVSVTIEILLLRSPVPNFPFECSISFGDGASSLHRGVPARVNHSYTWSNIFLIQSECVYMSQSLISTSRVTVETHLTEDLLRLQYQDLTNSHPVTLLFTHQSTPLNFLFVIKDENFSSNGISYFNLPSGRYLINVTLEGEVRERLGEGFYKFDLLLENNISVFYFSSSFALVRTDQDFNISIEDLKQSEPGKFETIVEIFRDISVNVKVQVKESTIACALVTSQTECIDDCTKLKIQGSIPQFNVPLLLNITAFNEHQSSSESINVTFTPRVYDVYIESLRAAKAFDHTQLLFLISADDGVYDITMRWADQIKEFAFSTFLKSPSIDVTTRQLPGNFTRYHQHLVNVSFYSIGHQIIDVICRLEGDEFKFRRSLFVEHRTECHPHIRTRLPRGESWIKNTFSTQNSFLISADTQPDKCLLLTDLITYHWWVTKVASFEEPLDFEKTTNITSYVDDSKFVFQPSTLLPGTYVIKLSVASRHHRTKKIQWREEVYISAEVVARRSLKFRILGGYLRESGSKNELIQFETSLKPKKNYVIEWYCSVKKHFLPITFLTHALPKKEKCFTFQTNLFVTRKADFVVSTQQLEPHPQFHMRAFVQQPGFAPEFADQTLVIKSESTTNPKLRCVYNCLGRTNPGFPIIFIIECPLCHGYQWSVQGETPIKLDQCEEKRICKLTIATLRESNITSSFDLIGKGRNEFKEEFSSYFRVDVIEPPKKGNCDVTRTEIFHLAAKLGVTCTGYQDPEDNLFLYSFYLVDKKMNNPIIQYGYDNKLSDAIIPLEVIRENASIRVEVCNALDVCVEQLVPINESQVGDGRSTGVLNITKSLVALTKLRNFQRILQVLTAVDLRSHISEDQLNSIVSALHQVRYAVMETAKLSCDILNYATQWVEKFSPTAKIQAWNILVKIVAFIKRLEQPVALEVLAPSCVSSALKLLRSSRELKLPMLHRVRGITGLLMKTMIPGDDVIETDVEGSRSYLQQTYREDNRLELNEEIRGLKHIESGDVINLEVHHFDGMFISSSHFVDKVVLVSISTGWSSKHQITNEERSKLSSRFQLPREQTRHTNVTLNVLRCFNRSTRYFRAWSFLQFNLSFNANESRKFSLLTFRLNVTSAPDMESLVMGNLRFRTVANNEVDVTENFFVKDNILEWSIALKLLPLNQMYEMLIGLLYYDVDSAIYKVKASLYIFTANCYIWNDLKKDWSSDKCQTSDLKLDTSLSCICYDFPPINETDSDEDQFLYFGTRLHYLEARQVNVSLTRSNIFAIGFLPVMSLSLIVLCLFSHLKDESDIDKGEELQSYTHELEDNFPQATYKYVIIFYTDWRPFSGTDCWVTMRVVGKRRKTTIRLVQTPSKPILMKRCSVVLMTTYKSLGEITSIQIFHGHGGFRSIWNLQRITIKDMKTNKVWFLICKVQFSPMTFCIFNPATLDQLNNMQYLRVLKFSSNFLNRHLWNSLLLRDPWQVWERRRTMNVAAIVLQISTSLAITSVFFTTIQEKICVFNWSEFQVSFARICLFSSMFVYALFGGFDLPFQNMIKKIKKQQNNRKKKKKKKSKKSKEKQNVKTMVKANEKSLDCVERHLEQLADRARDILTNKLDDDQKPLKKNTPLPSPEIHPQASISNPFTPQSLRRSPPSTKSILRKHSPQSRSNKKTVRFEKKRPKIKIVPRDGEGDSASSVSTEETDSSSYSSSFSTTSLSSYEEMPHDAEITQNSAKGSSLKRLKLQPQLNQKKLLPSTGFFEKAVDTESDTSSDVTPYCSVIKSIKPKKTSKLSLKLQCFLWVCWTLVVISCLIFSAFRSFSFTSNTINLWLSAAFAVIFITGIVIETIKVLLYSLIVVWRYPEHNPKHWIPPLHGTVTPICNKVIDQQRLIRSELNSSVNQTLPDVSYIPEDRSENNTSSEESD